MTQEINSKTNIPLVWAASIVMAIAGVLFSSGIAYAKFGSVEQQIQKSEASRLESDKQHQAQELKIQRLQLSIESIDKSLQSIDKKIDRLERK